MKDAYEECALGPTITFHASRFYFRIDHVLYKGNFEAIDIERGDQKSSDHYPLLTTFKWK
jgi:endonuclease/exonuclease/phosphatase (EEP) superfamily protein YafD